MARVDRPGVLSRYGYHLVVAVVASLVYLNCLPNEFAFDDHFAITRNKDVVDPTVPLKDLLHHDFWGQEVSKRDSHKSYRPITVLSFRLNDRLASRQAGRDNQGVHPHPFGFHIVNIVLHALVSALFYELACKILVPTQEVTRQGGPNGAPWTRWTGHVALAAGLLFAVHPVHTEAVTGIVGRAEMLSSSFFMGSLLMYMKSVDLDDGRMEWVWLLASVTCAFLGALAKETAITVLGALVVYDLVQPRPHPDAVDAFDDDGDTRDGGDEDDEGVAPDKDGRLDADKDGDGDKDKASDGEEERQGEPKKAGKAMPGKGAGASEGGLVVRKEPALGTVRQRKGAGAGAAGQRGGRQVTAPVVDAEEEGELVEVLSRGQKRTIRLASVLATVMLLMFIRRLVTGNDFVVTIFRKVENPLAYQPSFLLTVLSIVQLHALYFGLLLIPHPLSADWSFECIKLLDGVTDVRIIWPLLLYAAAVMVAVKAEPHKWDAAGGPWWCARMAAPALNRAIFFQVVALLGGPFLPSSNILFFVGTYIGERLLYLPSAGFCLLFATLVFHFLAPATPAGAHHGRDAQAGSAKKAGRDSGKDNGSSKGAPSAFRPVSISSAWAWRVLAVILVAFSWKTWTRNEDWLNEATLFDSAMNVCPRSAKVLLNSGILARTRGEWETCLQYMRKAKEVEPGYCDPDYWIGLTHINQAQSGVGKDMEGAVFHYGVGNLTLAVRCLHTVAESMRVLHQLYKIMHDSDPGNGVHMERFGSLFADLGLVDESCHHWHKAAETYNRAGNHMAAEDLIARCKTMRGNPPPRRFKELDGMLKEPSSSGSKGAARPSGGHPSLLSRTLDELIPGGKKGHPAGGPAASAATWGPGMRATPATGSDAETEKLCSEEFEKLLAAAAEAERHGMVPGVSPIPPALRARFYFFLANWNETCSAAVPYYYTHAVNGMQKLDSEDPWLHRAWAEAIVASLGVDGLGVTYRQAITHMKVAGMIFTSLGKRMLEPSFASRMPWISAELPFKHDERQYAVDLATGQKMSTEAVFRAAESALARAEEMNALIPDATSEAEGCQLRLFRGHIMLVLAHHLAVTSPLGLTGRADRQRQGIGSERSQLAAQQAARLLMSVVSGGGQVAGGNEPLPDMGPCSMEVQQLAGHLVQSITSRAG